MKKKHFPQNDFGRLIGVIHLPPLPGAPHASHYHHPSEALQVAGHQAIEEAKLFAQSGFDSVIVENFGDTPFYPTRVGPETISSLSVIVAAVRETIPKLKLGVNVLRNDALSALAIAAVNQVDFIRVNVLSGVAATDQGLIMGEAHLLLRERMRLRAESVGIMADVHVKHAKTLSTSSLTLAIEDAVKRAHAQAIVITGASTGRQVKPEALSLAHESSTRLKIPLYVGSGVEPDHLIDLKSNGAWGVIVGSFLRKKGLAGAPLDKKRISQFVKTWEKAF